MFTVGRNSESLNEELKETLQALEEDHLISKEATSKT